MMLQGLLALAHAASLAQPCLLTRHSTTLHALNDGQVIENVAVDVTSGAAISVHGYKRVTIRNVEITFGPNATGIEFGGADDLMIVNASLRLVGAPTATGALPSASALAITGSGSANVRINRVRAEGCSSGVYLVQCPWAHVSNIEGHNMRGARATGRVADSSANRAHCTRKVPSGRCGCCC